MKNAVFRKNLVLSLLAFIISWCFRRLVTQLLDAVPVDLHGPDLFDVHGELGHRVHVQLSLIFSHTFTP
jgi:hypothetical protein